MSKTFIELEHENKILNARLYVALLRAKMAEDDAARYAGELNIYQKAKHDR